MAQTATRRRKSRCKEQLRRGAPHDFVCMSADTFFGRVTRTHNPTMSWVPRPRVSRAGIFPSELLHLQFPPIRTVPHSPLTSSFGGTR